MAGLGIDRHLLQTTMNPNPTLQEISREQAHIVMYAICPFQSGTAQSAIWKNDNEKIIYKTILHALNQATEKLQAELAEAKRLPDALELQSLDRALADSQVECNKLQAELSEALKWKEEDPRMLREQIRVADIAFNTLHKENKQVQTDCSVITEATRRLYDNAVCLIKNKNDSSNEHLWSNLANAANDFNALIQQAIPGLPLLQKMESLDMALKASCQCAEQFKQERDTLRSQLAEVSKDKERLDVQNDRHYSIWWNSRHEKFVVQDHEQVCGSIGSGNTNREAIDSAIAKEQEE